MTTPTATSTTLSTATQPDLRPLARLLAQHAPGNGLHALAVPGAFVSRATQSAPTSHAVHTAALCIVAQGAKRVWLGTESYTYDTTHMLVVAVDVPMAAQIIHASPAEPYLCLRLDLNPHQVAELVLRVYPHGAPPVREQRGVYVGRSSAGIVDAATRLVALCGQPEDAALLAPLAVEEILIRLLRSPVGPRLAQVGARESGVQRIAAAVAWLRAHYDQPMNVETLAASVHMSASSFHQHFKSVTSLSPLQYQKTLRLQEARRLMLAAQLDASEAARQVGYLSPSQFSREYARFFGAAPTRDMARLRQPGLGQPEAALSS